MSYLKIAPGVTINPDLLLYSFIQEEYTQPEHQRIRMVFFVFQAPHEHSGIQTFKIPVGNLRYGYERDFGE